MTGADYTTVLPEIVMAVSVLALLMIGVFKEKNSTSLVAWLSVGVMIACAILVLMAPGERVVAFSGQFVSDPFSHFAKIIILAASAVGIIMSLSYIKREGMNRFEFPLLLLVSTLGMMMMVSANNLITLYMGLELQSLALYVVASFRRDTIRSTEAGLKYFVLGALSSGMLLYGMSMIYGFAGTTSFDGIAAQFTDGSAPPIGLVVGIVFLCAGLAFKVSAVPFHMWTPDVYEGAPTPVTAFFAVAPKVAAIALFLRAMIGPFGDLVDQWQQIIVFISLASMVLGAVAAINQTNIKRLMAYSSIGHMGFALVGLAAGTEDGVRGVLVYMAIYLFMNVGTFAVILMMRQNDRMVENISDLAGLSRTKPATAMMLAILMFSMAGIPPLAGFFGKFFVFKAAIDAGLVTLAVVGVLASVVGAFYYLRIIKLMYFDEPAERFDEPVGIALNGVMVVSSVVVIALFAFLGPLLSAARFAASSLFGG
ncbi:MAG: NADH-quinone oxidoreductase subunit NuoN [Pseudomonadota bacterium]